MFVEALTEYADTRLAGQLADLAFESKPVPYLLEIGADGSFIGIVNRYGFRRPGNANPDQTNDADED